VSLVKKGELAVSNRARASVKPGAISLQWEKRGIAVAASDLTLAVQGVQG
jgi:hypothetical protein